MENNVFNALVDGKGRVNYEQLKSMVTAMSLSDFVEQAQHPFIMGKELYDGGMRRDYFSSTATMKFSKNVFAETPHPPAETNNFTQTIYALRKKTYSPDPDNMFSIGRTSDNDIVMADFVISKRHACIIYRDGAYYITDCGSTNGTKVERQIVKKDEQVQIMPGMTISFGRLVFVFAHPLMVYRGLRKDSLGR